MRTFKYNRMLKLGIFVLLAGSFAAAAGELPASSKRLVSMVDADFRKASSVSFYFVSRTGNYVLSDDEVMKEATLRVTRECGNNCASFMRRVIDHLRNARQISCTTGQENLVISTNGGAVLSFSYSGRSLRYGKSCFFTPVGVNSVLKKDGFFFE